MGSDLKKQVDFLGGLLSLAGDVGLIPGRGTKIPRGKDQLSPCTTATESALEPAVRNEEPRVDRNPDSAQPNQPAQAEGRITEVQRWPKFPFPWSFSCREVTGQVRNGAEVDHSNHTCSVLGDL